MWIIGHIWYKRTPIYGASYSNISPYELLHIYNHCSLVPHISYHWCISILFEILTVKIRFVSWSLSKYHFQNLLTCHLLQTHSMEIKLQKKSHHVIRHLYQILYTLMQNGPPSTVDAPVSWTYRYIEKEKFCISVLHNVVCRYFMIKYVGICLSVC